MADNLPLPLSYEDARGLRDSLESWIRLVQGQLVDAGYDLSIIERELALLLARKAAKFGVDLIEERPSTKKITPINGTPVDH